LTNFAARRILESQSRPAPEALVAFGRGNPLSQLDALSDQISKSKSRDDVLKALDDMTRHLTESREIADRAKEAQRTRTPRLSNPRSTRDSAGTNS